MDFAGCLTRRSPKVYWSRNLNKANNTSLMISRLTGILLRAGAGLASSERFLGRTFSIGSTLITNYFVCVNDEVHPPACQTKFEGFKHGPVSNGYIYLTGDIMAVDFWMQQVKHNATLDGRDILVHLVKNGVSSSAAIIDSFSRLEAQPILKGKKSEKGTAMRQLYCLRFCSKPFPSFGGGCELQSEGALLLVCARPSMRNRQLDLCEIISLSSSVLGLYMVICAKTGITVWIQRKSIYFLYNSNTMEEGVT